MIEKLKPCPFCGGKAEINLFLGNYCVTCNNCMVAVLPYKKMEREKLIKSWNRRVNNGKID